VTGATTREDRLPQETDATSVIVAAFASLTGKRLLDIGCGAGVLAHSLSDQGAQVSGVDPNADALTLAREAVPKGTFHPTGAEALPFTHDSLHHVPKARLHQALGEAARVVVPAGPIVVVEPLAEGSFFFALRPVEDETDVRTASQEALHRVLESGEFEQLRRVEYLRREHFEGLDEFVGRVVAVDPARAAAVAENRSEIEAAFWRHARVAAGGRMTLEQPMRAHVLRASTEAAL
jgi:ubiquinone/menaquinone biosynthesis C-methylase UbiE